jgi:hypothetical protein
LPFVEEDGPLDTITVGTPLPTSWRWPIPSGLTGEFLAYLRIANSVGEEQNAQLLRLEIRTAEVNESLGAPGIVSLSQGAPGKVAVGFVVDPEALAIVVEAEIFASATSDFGDAASDGAQTFPASVDGVYTLQTIGDYDAAPAWFWIRLLAAASVPGELSAAAGPFQASSAAPSAPSAVKGWAT